MNQNLATVPPAIREFSGTYRFLSNFYVERQGLTVEHWFQASKTLDPLERKTVLEAKRLGGMVTLRPDWDDVRIQVMSFFVAKKFRGDPELTARLRATGEALLVEGNTWGDTFWGVDLETGKGENHLGVILMAIRAGLNFR
jgi:ribA/ribD-fused uncharacterized protein